MAYKPPQVATSYNNNNTSNCRDIPADWYQPPTPIPDTQPTPTPFEYDKPVVLLVGNVSNNNGANKEPDQDIILKQLAHELIALGDASRSWAEEMENEIGLTLQGE
jgi:hypothetical protein